LLSASQVVSASQLALEGDEKKMDIAALFIGFIPDEVFGSLISVDAAELVIVFGTIAISLGFMVAFGNWWSR
jgi:hypothetical protein